MNFNYDLNTWIEFFIGAFACCFGLFYCGKILLNTKIKTIKAYSYILIIIFTIFLIFNTLVFDNIWKIFGVIMILFIIYRIIFKKNNFTSLFYSITTHIIFLVSEVIMSIILLLIQKIFNINMTVISFDKTFILNFLISIISCIIAYFIRKKVKVLEIKFNKNHYTYLFILGIITIFIMLSTMHNLSLNNWKIDYKFILNLIIFVGCISLLLNVLKQFLANKEMTTKYMLLNDYLKNSADLIEKYSSTIHKYKNNLIVIKGYLNSNSKEVNNYINSLLDDMGSKKYNWVKKINYISIETLRYIIYYKLAKAEEKNLKIFVSVNKNISKIEKLEELDNHEFGLLLDILGEYFDNAIYASNESKEKLLNFDMYEENGNLIFNISNTYKGNIELSLITKNGYTTKGTGHGFGLYDIEKTTKNMDTIRKKYEIIDKFFVTTLYVRLNKLKKDK